jgi:hypothetical protein
MARTAVLFAAWLLGMISPSNPQQLAGANINCRSHQDLTGYHRPTPRTSSLTFSPHSMLVSTMWITHSRRGETGARHVFPIPRALQLWQKLSSVPSLPLSLHGTPGIKSD